VERASIIMTLIVIALFNLAIIAFVLRRLPRFAVATYVTMMLVYMVLVGAHIVLIEFERTNIPYEVRSYLSMRSAEFKPSAVYASLQFALVGFVALTIARLGRWRAPWERRFWWYTAFLFLLMAIDEYFVLHEMTNDWWIPAYGLMGMIYVFGAYRLHRLYYVGRDYLMFILMVGGLVLSAGGAVGVEKIDDEECFHLVPLAVCNLALLEETLENFGMLTVALGIMTHAANHLSTMSWSKSRRFIVFACIVWVVTMQVISLFHFRESLFPLASL
jgi:hypothetical protein